MTRDDMVTRLEALASEVGPENPATAAVLQIVAASFALNRARDLALHLKPFCEENADIIRRLKAERN